MRKKKILIAAVLVVVLGVAYWLTSPFFIDKRISEDFPVNELGERGESAGYNRSWLTRATCVTCFGTS